MTKPVKRSAATAIAAVCAIGGLTGSGSLLLGDRDAHAIIGTVHYACAGARYAPYYSGPTVVYQPM